MSGYEFKSPAALAPGPHSTGNDTGPLAVDPARATVTMIAAVTGTVDEVADKIIPGAFTRSIKARLPKVCRGHDWQTPITRIVSIKELLPGDPRLPRTTGSGRPWPREAGALIAQARLNTAIPAGRDALEMIKFYGSEAAFSIGYKAVKSRQRNGVRELLDVELFEVSPVLHGAHPDARLIDVKRSGGAIEWKSSAGAAVDARRGFRDRPGLPRVVACSTCRRPAAALVGGGLKPNEALVCASCVEAMADGLDQHVARIDPADLAVAEELTSEQEYEAALDGEIEWHIEADGALARGPRSAWTPDSGSGRRP